MKKREVKQKGKAHAKAGVKAKTQHADPETDNVEKSEREESAQRLEPVQKPNDVEVFERALRERDEYLNLLQRTRAEFSNYRKRVERERRELSAEAVGAFVKQLLPALDDLDRAIDATDENYDPEAFVDGIHLVSEKLRKALTDAGVSVVDPKSEQFDPEYHEAVMAEEHDGFEPGTVSDVLLKGYLMQGRALRAAQVKVVKAPSEPADKSDEPSDKPDETEDENHKEQ